MEIPSYFLIKALSKHATEKTDRIISFYDGLQITRDNLVFGSAYLSSHGGRLHLDVVRWLACLHDPTNYTEWSILGRIFNLARKTKRQRAAEVVCWSSRLGLA